jgi:hypothetical protein
LTAPLDNDRAWALFYRDSKDLDYIAAELGCDKDDLMDLHVPIKSIMDHSLDVIGKLKTIIDIASNQLRNQEKTIDNLVEALDAVTGRKKAEAEAAKRKGTPRVKFGKNSDWLQSVRMGIAESIWWAPVSLWQCLRTPLFAVVMGLLSIIGQLLGWTVARFLLLGLGLFGRLAPATTTATEK